MIVSNQSREKSSKVKVYRKHNTSERQRNSQFEPYESPLNCLKTSMTQVADLVENLVNHEEESYSSHELNELNTVQKSRNNSAVCNVTIVINDDTDDDNEIIDEKINGEKNITLTSTKRRRETPISPSLHHKPAILGTCMKNLRKRKRSSIILLDTSTSSQRKSLTLEPCSKKLKQERRSPIILLDDSSPIVTSSTQRTSNTVFNKKRIIAPTKTEDDIVELWSNLRNPSNINKTISKQNEHENKKDRPLRNKLRIGATSSTSNPEFLNASRISSCLREKYLASTNKISCPNESIIQTTSNSVNGKKNRKLDEDNMNLDPIQSNENFKRKTRSSNSTSENSSHKLREIVIDGCNIAMLHTNGRSFSEKGILLMLDYFLSRGHVVKVFLPQCFQKEKRYPFLDKLYRKGIVVFTPYRYIAGRQIRPYDDRFILEYATKCKGIVISSDQYRDLYEEKPEWRDTILNRLLTPTFVEDYIMFPEDPLGRSGPNLYTFLRH